MYTSVLQTNTCGFKYYEAGSNGKELMFHMNILNSMSEFYSGVYRLEMPSLGLNEQFNVFNIGK